MASRKIKNSFLDLIAHVLSFVLNIGRSIGALIGKKSVKMKQNTLFDTLHFIFHIWPKYFWKSPSLYKFFAFPGDVLNYIFKK